MVYFYVCLFVFLFYYFHFGEINYICYHFTTFGEKTDWCFHSIISTLSPVQTWSHRTCSTRRCIQVFSCEYCEIFKNICSVYSKPYKHVYFLHLVIKTLFAFVGIVSYKKLFLIKEVGLVFMSRNSAAVPYTSSLS